MVVSFNLRYFGSMFILFDIYKFIINYVLGLCFICKNDKDVKTRTDIVMSGFSSVLEDTLIDQTEHQKFKKQQV